MKNRQTPDIRFPGFPGDWKQCNLGDISTKIGSGKTPKGGDKNYKSEGIPLLRSQNIFNNKVNFNDVVCITPEIDEDMSNSRVQKGDVLLNITGASIGRSAVYELNQKANVNQHVSIIRPSREVNPYFIQLNITSEKGKKQIELNQAGGGREGLNFQQIAKMNFFFPSLVEQEKIGHFFIQLESTITLHQQELINLKQTKKGFLHKMFPKEGESVPEVRFPGFTGEWEEFKLREVATFINGRAYKQNELLNSGKYKVLRVGNLYTNDFWYYSDLELGEKYYAEKGDLLYTWSATFGPHIWYGDKVIYHYHIWKMDLSDNLDKQFTIQLLEYDKARILSDKNGSTMVHITKKGMEEKKVLLPSIEEQIKIGNFFKQLDDTIALHQRELDALKETKKAFLQKMFV